MYRLRVHSIALLSHAHSVRSIWWMGDISLARDDKPRSVLSNRLERFTSCGIDAIEKRKQMELLRNVSKLLCICTKETFLCCLLTYLSLLACSLSQRP